MPWSTSRILRSEARLEDRYVLAGMLIVACILTFAFAGDGKPGRMIAVALQSVTLIIVLRASQIRPRTVRLAGLLCVGLFVFVALAQTSDGAWASAAPSILGAVLALCGPVAIIRRLVKQPVINFTTIAGALCVYLLAGLFFALLYGSMSQLHSDEFFAQQQAGSAVDFVYFSFVTLTTTGYGDLTAAFDSGRMTAILEALFGQLYLVSIVALLVANMGRARRPRETGAGESTIEGTP
jgi:Ion channel